MLMRTKTEICGYKEFTLHYKYICNVNALFRVFFRRNRDQANLSLKIRNDPWKRRGWGAVARCAFLRLRTCNRL